MRFAFAVYPYLIIKDGEFHTFICAPCVNCGKIADIGHYFFFKIILLVIWSKKSINGLHFNLFALTLIYQHGTVKLYK